MATVRTTAGKRLLANEAMNARSFALITTDAIAAIEAEAAVAERARLADAGATTKCGGCAHPEHDGSCPQPVWSGSSGMCPCRYDERDADEDASTEPWYSGAPLSAWSGAARVAGDALGVDERIANANALGYREGYRAAQAKVNEDALREAAQAVVRTWYGQQDETWADRMHADVGVLLVTLSDTSHAGEADW